MILLKIPLRKTDKHFFFRSLLTNLRELQEIQDELSDLSDVVIQKDIDRYIADFLRRQEELWRKNGWEKSDVETLFTEKHLASLSLKDYILLLQRFPGELVTHATRFGVRTSTRLYEHQHNIGVYHDHFARMIQHDKRLHSVVSAAILYHEVSEEFFTEFLGFPKNRAEAIDRLSAISTSPPIEMFGSGTFGDRSAIHFAAETVLSEYYGGETGNHIFTVFPSVFIANSCYFTNPNKSRGDFTNPNTPDSHDINRYNDIYVIPPDGQKGLAIDAGIVFLPKDARVDKNTGSQYRLDEKKCGIPTTAYGVFRNTLIEKKGEKIISTVENMLTKNKNREQIMRKLTANLLSWFPDAETRFVRAFIREIKELLQSEINASEENLLPIEIGNIKNTLRRFFASPFDFNDPSIQQRCILLNAYYELADDTISSQEYWEQFFIDHPNSQPKHVVFYSGDPILALEQWKRENRITNKLTDSKTTHAGFPEKRLTSQSVLGHLTLRPNKVPDYYPEIHQSPITIDLSSARAAFAAVLMSMINNRFPEE